MDQQNSEPQVFKITVSGQHYSKTFQSTRPKHAGPCKKFSDALIEKYRNKPLKTELYSDPQNRSLFLPLCKWLYWPVKPLDKFTIFCIHTYDRVRESLYPGLLTINKTEHQVLRKKIRDLWNCLDHEDRLQYFQAQELDQRRYENDVAKIKQNNSPSKVKKRLSKIKNKLEVELANRSIFTDLTNEIDIDKYLDILGYRL